MAIARKRQVSLADTRYYHCISRCVRRAFLCGEDHFTGQSYEHRRGWVEDRLLALAKVFCIDTVKKLNKTPIFNFVLTMVSNYALGSMNK